MATHNSMPNIETAGQTFKLQAQIGAKDVEYIVILCVRVNYAKKHSSLPELRQTNTHTHPHAHTHTHICLPETKTSDAKPKHGDTRAEHATQSLQAQIGAKDVECIVTRCVRVNYAKKNSSLPARAQDTAASEQD